LLNTLRGNHRPIRDYFVTEILRTQPQEIQDFLLRTSLLTRLSPSLCSAITGRQNSSQLLETIERSNLFLEALDGNSEWYRYQTLFAEAMQHEAHQQFGEQEIAQIFQAASQWFEQQNLLPEAIEMELKLKEDDQGHQAARLIEQHVETLGFIDSHEHHSLLLWLEQIPEATIRQHPLLCLCIAVGTVFGQNQEPDAATLERMQYFLHMAEEGWRDRPAELGRVLAFRAFIGLQRGPREQAVANARLALEWLPEKETVWRSMSLIVLGLDALQTGHLHRARPFFQKIHQNKAMTNIPHFLDGMTILLGIICFAQGDLYQAAHHFRGLCERYSRVEDNPISAASYFALALISYEWNLLDLAEQQFQEGLRLIHLLPDAARGPLSDLAEFVQAILSHAHGKTSQAIPRLTRLLIKARVHLQPSGNDLFPFLYQEVVGWIVRHALQLGDHATAQYWLEDLTRQYAPHSPPLLGPPSAIMEPDTSQDTQQSLRQKLSASPTLQEGKNLLAARLHLAQGNAETALTMLQDLLPAADAAGRGHILLQIRLLLAQAYALHKRQAESQQILLQALEQGQTANYQRSFLDEGPPLFLLLHDLFSHIQSPPLVEYVQTLFHAFRETQREAHITGLVPDLFEPLSKRERRVLRLLVAGRSNQEIAEELVVSINTVRTQIQSIYRKLQVNNRQAASEAARRLNLH
jgi:LuxR family transcriptional regulator, maltose regulon positive regulatory protein